MSDLALHLIAAGIRPKMMPLFRRLARSTVHVEHPTPGGYYGTGIILAVSPTVILTAAHLAAEAGQGQSLVKRIGFDRKTGAPRPIGKGRLADLVWHDRQCDLAVLTFQDALPNSRPARLKRKARLKAETPLYRLGNDNVGMAAGYFLMWDDFNGWPELVASAYNDSGGSGGPLAIKGPKVIGIVLRIPTAPRTPPQTLALPIEEVITRLMNEPGVRPMIEGRVSIE